VDPTSRAHAKDNLEPGFSPSGFAIVWVMKLGAMKDALQSFINIVDICIEIDVF